MRQAEVVELLRKCGPGWHSTRAVRGDPATDATGGNASTQLGAAWAAGIVERRRAVGVTRGRSASMWEWLLVT